MLDKLKSQIEVEQRLLHRLLETHGALLAKCRISDPIPDELAALAAILHAFYNGIENIFKRVATELDGIRPRGGAFWHAELIESMSIGLSNRPALLSKELSEQLQEYLDFRHVFRHTYSFDLNWNKMRHLVIGMEVVLKKLEDEIENFFARLDE